MPRALARPSVVAATLLLVALVMLDSVTNARAGRLPAAPSLSLSPQSSQNLHFSWANVAGATEYRLLEDPDGHSGYTAVATVAAERTHHDLRISLHERINARYILQACSRAGCTDSTAVYVTANLAEILSQQAYVKASNTGAGDRLGWRVAISDDGNTLAAGAIQEDSNATGVNGSQADSLATDSGAVYVFTRNNGTWSQQAYVKASNTGAADLFGESVALAADGNTLAVGAIQEDSNATGLNGNQADNSATDSGAVYVFTRSNGTWSQHAYVKASNTGAGDRFGGSVALSADGNTLAVGAIHEDSSATGLNGNEADNSFASSGAVYLFTRSGGSWSQQAYVKASNTGADDLFGYSVALAADGSTLAVGAEQEFSSATGLNGNQADNSAFYSGAVYVFTGSGGSWSQQAYVKASNTASQDFFGGSVALAADGNTLAVGASFEDSSATGLNGNEADNSSGESGAVYVFTRSSSTWSQQAYVKASNTGGSDGFGWIVGLSADGNTLAVGANSEDSAATGLDGNQSDNSAGGSGAVYRFTRNDTTWSQQNYIKASNTAGFDTFGHSVALSADASTLVVGAIFEDSSATGINGNQANDSAGDSGAVYVFATVSCASTGTAGNDALCGTPGDDVLDGKGGADTMTGFAGNDIYYVQDPGDVVVEALNEGTDTARSSITYALPSNVENLTLTGTASINGTGNGLANALNGNAADNVLNGKAGADAMTGKAGNDTYYIDNTGDRVTEGVDQGTDTIRSTVTRTLPTNVENLILTGSANINGTGNTLANKLTGNGVANTLNGKEGIDTLTGGAGPDRFLFNTAPNSSTNYDKITDFNPADDTIRLENAVFTGLPATGTLAASAFKLGTAASAAAHRIIYDPSTGNLRYDADGSGPMAAVRVATLTTMPTLTNTDFYVQ